MLSVFCLCADWCTTCREFQSVFEQLGALTPTQRYTWIDVEKQEQQLEDCDVENFPTIVIADEKKVYFFGPILPHGETLQRLCEAAKSGDLDPIHDENLQRIAQRLVRQESL